MSSFLESLYLARDGAFIPPPGPAEPKKPSREVLPMWDAFVRVEEALHAKGWHYASDFWREHLYRFWRGNHRRFAARAGRRGGKSSTMCKVAVAECLYSDYHIPFGDLGVFTIVSKDRDDARDRVRNIAQILEALGVPHVPPTKDEILFRDWPIKIKTYVATLRSIVGHTSIGVLVDEVARWQDGENRANPAKEVLASLRPSMKTQQQAHEYMISSPWGVDDAHYNTIEQGITEHQYVCEAPTWVANPTITREDCEREETDPTVFEREYAAVPMPAGTAAFFDVRTIDDAFTSEQVLDVVNPSHVAGMDLGFSRDHSSLVIVRLEGPVRRVVYVEEISPSKTPNVYSQVVERFSAALKEHSCKIVMADSHYRKAIQDAFNKKEILVVDAPVKPMDTYLQAKKLFSDGLVRIPPNKSLRKQLLSINSFPRIGGSLQIVLPRSIDGHCDAASALVLALYQRRYECAEEVKVSVSEEERLFQQVLGATGPRDDECIYDRRDIARYASG